MRKKRLRNICCCLTAALVCLSLLPGCGSRADTPCSRTGTYFDTVITITLYDPDQEQLIDDCFAMADRYEKLFSRTVADSDVSRINAAGGEFVPVDEETIRLISYGLQYSELSGGKFDITVGALSDLWDVSDNPGQIPAEQEISAALDTVGYENVAVRDNEAALTKEGVQLDLGGIAKGYIADQMKDYLEEQGVTSALINLGGNVLTIGSKPDGKPYTIALQKPFDDAGSAIAAVEVTDQTVVSSGIYERYFESDGKIYHHIIDTSTGYPVENDLLGVTIICDRSVDGDGLSTVCFSLGAEDGMALIESLEDTEAIFITKDYELIVSSGIGDTVPFRELM